MNVEVVQGEHFFDVCDVILTRAVEENVSLMFHVKCLHKVIRYDELVEQSVESAAFERRYLIDSRIAKLRDASKLFVFAHEIEDFLRIVQPLLTKSVTLVMHNKDELVCEDALAPRLSPHVRAVFTQNLERGERTEPRGMIPFYPLPIGVANSCWSHGKQQKVAFLSKFFDAEEWKTRWCYFWFNVETNPIERRNCKRQLQGTFEFDTEKPFSTYAAHLLQHRFAVCPEGRGPDTHRFWECLYLGVIPIVRRCEQSSIGKFYDNWPLEKMPVVVVEQWSELSLQKLQEQYSELRSRFTSPTLRSQWDYVLRLSYYIEQIESVSAPSARSTSSSAMTLQQRLVCTQPLG